MYGMAAELGTVLFGPPVPLDGLVSTGVRKVARQSMSLRPTCCVYGDAYGYWAPSTCVAAFGIECSGTDDLEFNLVPKF